MNVPTQIDQIKSKTGLDKGIDYKNRLKKKNGFEEKKITEPSLVYYNMRIQRTR
mgnify:FL=1